MSKLTTLINAIESAYTWEGSAAAQVSIEGDEQVWFRVTGSSTVEHSGDESGIKQQVEELCHQKIEGYTIDHATCQIKRGSRNGDDGYNVIVTGEVQVFKDKA